MLKKYLPILLLTLYFFSFLIGELQGSYDRVAPQFLAISILNILGVIFLLHKKKLSKVPSFIIKSNILSAYSIYILISCISISVADNQAEALIVVSQYFTFYLCFVLVYSISRVEKLKFFRYFILITAFAILIETYGVLSTVIDYFIVNANAFERSNILRGFSGNINIVSFSLAAKFPILIYLFFKIKHKLYSIFILLAIVFLSFVIFILLSRGAFISYIIVLSILLIYKSFESLRVNYKKILSILIAIIITYSLTNTLIDKSNSGVIIDRVESIVDLNDASISSRLRYYDDAISIIKIKPLMGLGLGNWKFISIELDYDDMHDYIVPAYVHNDFLQIAAEIGVLGAVAYLMIFIFSLMNLVKYIRKRKYVFECISLMSIFSVYFIDSMLNFPVSRPISHIFIIFVLVSVSNINTHIND